ncbi:MAG: hypothetical protein FH756_00295 [Firmicutes bacterium]|nr:hypothetical protein [Bacillota bacterium]
MALLTLGLFFSLTGLFFFLFVPIGYSVAPVDITIDSVRRRFEQRLITGERGQKLDVIQKSKDEVVKIAMVSTLGSAGVILVLGFKPLGFWATVLAVVVSILILIGLEFVLQNEFKRWQDSMFDSMPTLVNFIPAFLSVGSITLLQSIKLTIPFLSDPLKSEMWTVWEEINRSGGADEALDNLRRRAKHPLMDTICSRILSLWMGGGQGSDAFSDLSDQIEEIESETVNRATTAKVAYITLLCILGMAAGLLIYGYPGIQVFMNQVTGSFGG